MSFREIYESFIARDLAIEVVDKLKDINYPECQGMAEDLENNLFDQNLLSIATDLLEDSDQSVKNFRDFNKKVFINGEEFIVRDGGRTKGDLIDLDKIAKDEPQPMLRREEKPKISPTDAYFWQKLLKDIEYPVDDRELSSYPRTGLTKK